MGVVGIVGVVGLTVLEVYFSLFIFRKLQTHWFGVCVFFFSSLAAGSHSVATSADAFESYCLSLPSHRHLFFQNAVRSFDRVVAAHVSRQAFSSAGVAIQVVQGVQNALGHSLRRQLIHPEPLGAQPAAVAEVRPERLVGGGQAAHGEHRLSSIQRRLRKNINLFDLTSIII